MEGKAENMGDFIEKRYKSKDEIKRNKRLFLRREHEKGWRIQRPIL